MAPEGSTLNRATTIFIVLAVIVNVTFVVFASMPTQDASSPDSSGATAGASSDGNTTTYGPTADWRSLYTVVSNDTAQFNVVVKWTDDLLTDALLDAIFVKYAFTAYTILTLQAKKPDGSWDTLAQNQFCEADQLQSLGVFFTERVGNTVTLSFSSGNYYPPHFAYLALQIFLRSSLYYPGHGPMGASWLTAAAVGIIGVIAIGVVILWKLTRR